MAAEVKPAAGTTWVYCRTCRTKGLVNARLGIRGAIDACATCQRGTPPDLPDSE